MRKVIITPRAKRQITAAAGWWLSHRDKAPEAFEEDLAAKLSAVADHPFAGEPVFERPGVRRVLMNRVQYLLYYRLSPSGEIQILALWHASRGSHPRL